MSAKGGPTRIEASPPVGGVAVRTPEPRQRTFEAAEERGLPAPFDLTRIDMGEPLPSGLRGRLEQALHADLSGVRVHDDAGAAAAARELGARAFTVGSDIHFAAGRFDPGSPDGVRLLAHEVAHTVQQQGAPPAVDPRVGSPGDVHERGAHAFADAFTRGQARLPAVSPASLGQQVVQRADDKEPPTPAAEAAVREALGAYGVTVAEPDVHKLAELYPTGFTLEPTELELAAHAESSLSVRRVPALQVLTVPPTKSGLTTYLPSIGHGRAVVVAGMQGDTIMLDAGQATEPGAAARGLFELMSSGLTGAPSIIQVSHLDADHIKDIATILRDARMSDASIEVTKQQIASELAKGRWSAFGLTAVSQGVVEVDVTGSSVHVRKSYVGTLEIVDMRLVSQHEAQAAMTTSKEYHRSANPSSPVTVVRDMVTGETAVYIADQEPKQLKEVIDFIDLKDPGAARRLFGGGGANLVAGELGHHGGEIGPRRESAGYVDYLRLLVDSSNGKLMVFTQGAIPEAEHNHLRVLTQIGIQAVSTGKAGSPGGGVEVARVGGAGTDVLTIERGMITEIHQAAIPVESDIMSARARVYELEQLKSNLQIMRDVMQGAGMEEPAKSVEILLADAETQRAQVQAKMDAFWSELKGATKKPGMRANVDYTAVQSAGRAAGEIVQKNPIDNLRGSAAVHEAMMGVELRLWMLAFKMEDALRRGDLKEFDSLKPIRRQLLGKAVEVLGEKAVLEHVRPAWQNVKAWYNPAMVEALYEHFGRRATEGGLRRSVVMEKRLGRLSSVVGVATEFRAQKIATLRQERLISTMTAMQLRGEAKMWGAFEIARLAGELTIVYLHHREAERIEAKNRGAYGKNFAGWWLQRGVTPTVALLDEDGARLSFTQEQIYGLVLDEEVEGVPENAYVVVEKVPVEDRLQAIRQLNIQLVTVNDWFRTLSDQGSALHERGWTPFDKVDGKWVTLEYNVDSGEYEPSFDQKVDDALSDLIVELLANQQSTLGAETAGREKFTVADTGIVQVYREVWVYGSSGGLMRIDMDEFEPTFVRSSASTYKEPTGGRSVVKAADLETYIELRKHMWPTGQEATSGEVLNATVFGPNEEGLALVDEASLVPLEDR